jgi:hypothetical protein
MAIRIRPGFRGIVRFNSSFSIRVTSADIQVRQEAQAFLGTVGGKDLKRIWHRGTGDIAGTLSFPLTEGHAQALYDLARDQEEFYIDLRYYGSKTRRFLGCKVQELSFTCAAGEIVQVAMNIVAKERREKVRSITYTKGEKLVTWDKCDVRFPPTVVTLADEALQGFTYKINNGLKSIKTAAGLFPKIINPAIQDVSGQFQFYNSDDLVVPPAGAYEYGLPFKEVDFIIEELEIEHDVVIHPSETIPLVPTAVISTLSWTRSDDFD